jgi:hypothetical protein
MEPLVNLFGSRVRVMRSHVPRVHGSDAGVAGEVGDVEGEQVRDGVHVHSGDDPRVVDLNAGDAMSHEQPAPLVVDRGAIGEEAVEAFDETKTDSR